MHKTATIIGLVLALALAITAATAISKAFSHVSEVMNQANQVSSSN